MVWPSKVMVPDWLPLGMLVTWPPEPFSTSVSKPPAPAVEPTADAAAVLEGERVAVAGGALEVAEPGEPLAGDRARIGAVDRPAVSADGPTMVLPVPVAEMVLAPV